MPFNPNMPGGGAMVPRGPQGSMPMQAPQVNPMMGMQRPRIPMPMPGQAPQQMQRPMPLPQMQPTPQGQGQINPQAIAAMMGRLQQMPAQNPGQMPMRPQMMPPQQMQPQMSPQQGPGALQSLLGVPNYSALQSRLRSVLGV